MCCVCAISSCLPCNVYFTFKQNSVLSYTKCIQNTKYLTKGMDDAKKVPSGQQTINSFFLLWMMVEKWHCDNGLE